LVVDGIIATAAAASWLTTTKEATLLSVFDRSCTLSRADGKLFSLVTAEIGPGPFTMVIAPRHERSNCNIQSFFSIRQNAPITFRNGIMSLDWLVVDSSGVEIWNPQPDWSSVTLRIIVEKSGELKNLLMLHAPSGSMADLITGAELNQSQLLVKDVWPDLAKGLRELDLRNCPDKISQITGLGGGLTPAGDDFLLGMMMAIWCCLPPPVAKRLAFNIVSATVGRTTTLSVAWLEAAGKGEATQYWHELIEALARGAPLSLQRAGLRLIGIGHTSGADALTGFLLVAEILSTITLPSDGISHFSTGTKF